METEKKFANLYSIIQKHYKMEDIPYSEIQFIDIDAVLQNRNPALKKSLPKFIISYIKRIAHQDDINKFLENYGTRVGLQFVEGMMEEFELEVEVKGIENLPTTKSQKLIFASNHPLGGLDGAAFLHKIGAIYPNIKTVINDILLNVKNMEGIFVGVNSFGKNKREQLARIDKMLKSDAQILIFPSGLVSRRKKGLIRDLKWKKTFIDWSKKYQRSIVPVHINGKVSNFFYNLANLRNFLGIKANIEMFYLANEMYKQKGQKLTITIGKPIDFTVFTKENRSTEWAELVRHYIYELAKNPKKEFM